MTKSIKLKSLTLINFKGVRDYTVHFNDKITIIEGDNATGKTTIADAYFWLLFGKDSLGRGDGANGFNVKTLGEDGLPIYRLEHSVTAHLEVGDKPIKLQRQLVEKWRKVNGTTEETMTDEQQYYVNDVRCGTKKEYNAIIAEIISEDIFRAITNPSYFTRLSAEAQKDMLIQMIGGEITDEEIIATSERFQALFEHINGTPLARFSTELAARKRSLHETLKSIPAQIETAQKLMPEREDWAAIEAERADKQHHLKKIEAQLTDASQATKEAYDKRAVAVATLGQKRIELANIESSIRRQAASVVNEAKDHIAALERGIQASKQMVDTAHEAISKHQQLITQHDKDLERLRENFTLIANQKYQAPEAGDTCCTTCGEPLRGDNLEKKLQEHQGNFEQHKAKQLKALREQGQSKKNAIESLHAAIEKEKEAITKHEAKRQELNEKLAQAEASLPTPQNAEEIIKADPKVQAIMAEIAKLEALQKEDITPADTSELQEAKEMLTEGIEQLTRRLATRDQAKRIEKELNDLNEKQLANNQALAELERIEDTYKSFIKAKDDKLEERVNRLFQYVSFSFIKEQKNGGEKLTCYCSVNGVPYNDVNTAGKINAGLDIINAICRATGYTAPIFLDNAESINDLLPTLAQTICLRVSQDAQLTQR